MIQQTVIEVHPQYVLNPYLDDIVLPEYGQPLPLDLETNGAICWKHKIRIIALHIAGQELLIIPEYYTKDELITFFKSIQANNNLIICHKTKFDTGFIYTNYGVLLENTWCTMLGSQILHGGSRKYTHDLGSVLQRELNIDLGEDKKELQKSFLNDKPLTPEQLAYAARDTKYLIPLKEVLEQKLIELEMQKVVKLENRLTPVLVKMESHGCLIDVDRWKHKLKEWDITRKDYIRQLDDELMKIFPMRLFMNINYKSSKQMINLFKEMKLPVPIKEENKVKKQSVDEATLDNYVNQYPDTPLKDFIRIFKSYKEYDKLLSTYGDSFLERLDSNNCIHTEYGQCITTTARLNSSNPNLQNIPSDKSGAGSALREFFIAPPLHSVITSDMSGAEIALAADFSKDDLLMKSLKEGTDMHSELATISATIIYDQAIKISKSKDSITVGKVTIIPQEFRDIHKSVTFSKFYKGGPKRVYEILARYINPVTPERKRMTVAKRISEAIDKALPKLSKYLQSKIDEANSKGYLVTTKIGRRRYFDSEVYGEAANAPIQGSNGDAIKIAMIKVDEYLSKNNIGRLVLSIHDELVCTVLDEYAEQTAQLVKKEMSNALSYFLEDLEGGASVSINKHWQK